MTWRTGPRPDGHHAESLTVPARQVYQAVLAAFTRTGQPPARSELERLARNLGASPDVVLAELARADAVAISPGGEIRAAYPFSAGRTPIRVSWAGSPAVYAMCAIDALGMSAMLGRPVTITAAEPDTSRIITVHVDDSRAPGVPGWPWCLPARRAIPAARRRTAPAGISISSPAAGRRGPGRAITPRSPAGSSPETALSVSASLSSAACCGPCHYRAPRSKQ